MNCVSWEVRLRKKREKKRSYVFFPSFFLKKNSFTYLYFDPSFIKIFKNRSHAC